MVSFTSAVNINLLFSCLAFLTLSAASTQQLCTTLFIYNGTEKAFFTCADLPAQEATLAWSYNKIKYTLDVAFSGTMVTPMGWIGWGINVDAVPSMIGASVLLGFRGSNGSNLFQYKLTYDTVAGTPPLPGQTDLRILNNAVDIRGDRITIFATLQLKPNQTKLVHIWNRGPGMMDVRPLAHDIKGSNLRGVDILDIHAGRTAPVKPPHLEVKNRHGAINIIGWGILLPMGVMSARYLRPFEFANPAWFYIHGTFQSLGYMFGFVGWAVGLRLGSYSKGVVHHEHRNIGTTIFALATLQIMSLLLRPNKDHKFRWYWNIYHHTIGYVALICILVNIYEGFNILRPEKKWQHAYTAFVVMLAFVSLILEAITWRLYLQKRKKDSQNPPKEVDEQAKNNFTYARRQDAV